MNKYLIGLFCGLLFTSCLQTASKNEVDQALLDQEGIEEKASPVEDEKIGFVHTVFFWMKDSLSEENIALFEEGLYSLGKVKTVKRFMVGTAAGTPREVVDNSYDYALILHFEDAEGQGAYQVDPIHTSFVKNSDGFWDRVQVYDTLLE